MCRNVLVSQNVQTARFFSFDKSASRLHYLRRFFPKQISSVCSNAPLKITDCVLCHWMESFCYRTPAGSSAAWGNAWRLACTNVHISALTPQVCPVWTLFRWRVHASACMSYVLDLVMYTDMHWLQCWCRPVSKDVRPEWRQWGGREMWDEETCLSVTTVNMIESTRFLIPWLHYDKFNSVSSGWRPPEQDTELCSSLRFSFCYIFSCFMNENGLTW